MSHSGQLEDKYNIEEEGVLFSWGLRKGAKFGWATLKQEKGEKGAPNVVLDSVISPSSVPVPCEK